MSPDAGKIWSPGSLPGDLLSHPKRLLKDHLCGTAGLALALAREYGVPVDVDILRQTAHTHDLGKADERFQRYIREESKEGVNHALPSSFFTIRATDSLWAAEAVRRHHTHMVDVRKTCAFWIEKEDPEGALRENRERMAPSIVSWNRWMDDEKWEDFIDPLYDLQERVSADDWLTMRGIFSLLIAADRMDAIGMRDPGLKPIPQLSPVDFSERRSGPVDDWRGEIHRACLLNAGSVITSPGLYTLTLPTGAGKTMTGLEIAHDVAVKMNCRTIIYALPFISIVEQNSAVAKELFGSNFVQEDHSQFVEDENDDKDNESTSSLSQKMAAKRMAALFRYWEAPVVLTTMVQLWNAIFDPRANASMDFHKLGRAVVVMDEPQGIPPKFWSGFGKTMEFLSRKLGTFFILMTATQPHIGGGTELSPEEYEFPKVRHTYEVLPYKVPLDDLPHTLCKVLPVDDGSGLMVLNTKKSAIATYMSMREILSGEVFFLSAWMAPIHRKKVLSEIRAAQSSGIRHHLVSTQVVEAGVDLDFDWVFRDMGPLDSIVQVAGRCNRHGLRDKAGKVLVAEVVSGKGRSYCSSVYDDVLLDRSRRLLLNKTLFDERDVPYLVGDYYGEILDGIKFSPIWDDIENGRWGPSEDGEETKELIKKGFQGITVFVEIDSDIRDILKHLRDDRWTLESLDEKKRLAKKAQQYAIEVPVKELRQWRGELGSLTTKDELPPLGPFLGEDSWFLTKTAVGRIYDEHVGFMPLSILEGVGEGAMFI